MVRSCGRITKSAISRTSISDALSLEIAISMISPMIEVTGPICGDHAARQLLAHQRQRSATSCRLR